MKKETLLEKAKKIKIKRSSSLVENATKEQIELAIAWAKDEIRLGQATQILYNKTAKNGVGGKVFYTFACWLKAGIKKGIIK